MKWKKLTKRVLVLCMMMLPLMVVHGELYENYTRGGRVLGTGGAFAGLADDVYSLVYNPAGLVHLQGLVGNINYQPVMAYDDISAMGALIGFGSGALGLGAGYYQLGQDGGLSTSVISFGAAYGFGDLKFGPVYNLKAGLGADLYMASVEGYYATDGEGFNDSASAFGLGVGILFNIFTDAFSMGLYAKNLNGPSITFFDGGSGEKIKTEVRIGASYLFNDYFRVLVDYVIRDYKYTTDALANLFIGSEIYFYQAVMMRFGFDESRMTIGLGVNADDFELNGALRVEPDVEMYYQFDLSLKLNLAGSEAK